MSFVLNYIRGGGGSPPPRGALEPAAPARSVDRSSEDTGGERALAWQRDRSVRGNSQHGVFAGKPEPEGQAVGPWDFDKAVVEIQRRVYEAIVEATPIQLEDPVGVVEEGWNQPKYAYLQGELSLDYVRKAMETGVYLAIPHGKSKAMEVSKSDAGAEGFCDALATHLVAMNSKLDQMRANGASAEAILDILQEVMGLRTTALSENNGDLKENEVANAPGDETFGYLMHRMRHAPNRVFKHGVDQLGEGRARRVGEVMGSAGLKLLDEAARAREIDQVKDTDRRPVDAAKVVMEFMKESVRDRWSWTAQEKADFRAFVDRLSNAASSNEATFMTELTTYLEARGLLPEKKSETSGT